MSRKNLNPFDSILGVYSFPPTVIHHRLRRKSFLFVGDRWQEIGDIEFFYIPVSEEGGYLEMHPPDPDEYAVDHESEGAVDWLNWGPRVN